MRTSIILEKDRMREIIRRCDVCFLGLNDSDGFPYVIPMSFGFDDDKIILHSGPEGKHLRLIAKDNRASVVFCTARVLKYQHPDVACSYSQTSQSVVCKGTIDFVETLDEKERYLNILMRQYSDRQFKYSTPALKNVTVWLFHIKEMSAKSFGQNFKQ
ncbi:MAG: pyridoxamine 5'-phosphate oxidase family protein [Prevotellaceae bacterium]|jgi:nitroimidazol reductase NimA-like FMN-containing flavoprotein (pyridoxamine 5'-phosphate oxidase superfamily)|nr:pyridoxamine 5'-phosphate oxidase family protein [Prevotellaceae bacterium]